jgi:hypothetical protein
MIIFQIYLHMEAQGVIPANPHKEYKSRQLKGNLAPHTVTPAKAGVQKAGKDWIPAFAGMTPEAYKSGLKA